MIPHGNADVERSLSVNTNVVTKDRKALGEKTVTAIRTVKDAIKFSDPIFNQPHKIPINNEVLLYARMAHRQYKQRIELENEEKEKKKQEKEKESKEKKRKEELALEEKKKTKSVLDKEKEMLKKEMQVQSKLLTAEQLLKDGNKKLTKAVESGDLKGAGVAQMMIATATSKIETIRKEMDKVREDQRSIEEEKRQLLVKRLDHHDTLRKGKKPELSSSKGLSSTETSSTKTCSPGKETTDKFFKS